MQVTPKYIIITLGIVIILMMILLVIVILTKRSAQGITINNNTTPLPVHQSNQKSDNSYSHFFSQGTNTPQACNTLSCKGTGNTTEFFNKSAELADRALYTNSSLDGYKYGTKTNLSAMDANTKNIISLNIRQMTSDHFTARNTEERLRVISQQEGVPLWFVILHEAIKKIAPIETNPSIKDLTNEELLAELKIRKLSLEIDRQEQEPEMKVIRNTSA